MGVEDDMLIFLWLPYSFFFYLDVCVFDNFLVLFDHRSGSFLKLNGSKFCF